MEKIIIYQVFTRLFGNKNTTRIENGSIEENGAGKFVDFDTKTLRRIRQLGATHIWYTGVIRHASCTDYSRFDIPVQHPSVVKGRAGSPYAITDYYDVDPDLAVDVEKRMDEWEQLIQRTHKEGMRVVMDFVPNHVARQYQSIAKPTGVVDLGSEDNTLMHFSPQNNFYYCVGENFVSPNGTGYLETPAKATGNDCFNAHPSINDWYETVKLNYGIDYNDWSGVPSEHFDPIPSTWKKMTEILLFWADKGVDAFRCDMAEMVPCAFWEHSISILKKHYPDVEIIGEVYNPSLYRKYIAAGFDYLYDKVGMYDTLRAVMEGNCPSSAITSQWQSVDDIRNRMLYFLENHDEQRIASDYFAGNAKKAIPALIISSMLYGNPIMIYAGQEFGERGMDKEGFSGKDGRTTIFDYWCVDSLRRGFYERRKLTAAERSLESQYIRILNIAQKEKSIVAGASYDLMYVNPQMGDKQFTFLRGNNMLIVVNFADNDVESNVFIPSHAFDFLKMKEGEVEAADLLTDKKHNLTLKKDCAVKVSVPAYGGIVLKW
jgi:glycosidase